MTYQQTNTLNISNGQSMIIPQIQNFNSQQLNNRKIGKIAEHHVQSRKKNLTRSSLSMEEQFNSYTRKNISTYMDMDLYKYMRNFSKEHQALQNIREQTANVRGSNMIISQEQSNLMDLMIKSIKGERVLDIGCFTGYSSTLMALAIPDHGQVITFDKSDVNLNIAKQAWKEANVEQKITFRKGDAAIELDDVLNDWGPNSVDFAFIDADKRQYSTYYKKCMELVRPGGIILIDNALFYGRVVDQKFSDNAGVQNIIKTTEIAARDKRLQCFALLPIADGLGFCLKA